MINSYIYPERNKWIGFKEKVLSESKIKRYGELRKEFEFIPRSAIGHWIYPKNHKK